MKKYQIVSGSPIIGKNGKRFEKGSFITHSDVYPGVIDILLSCGKLRHESMCIELKNEDRILIFIFSYNRYEKLHSLINECKKNNCDVVVIDDGSDFNINHEHVIKLKHQGKHYHYKRWNIAFQIAKDSENKVFGFLADDFENVNFNFSFPQKNCVLNILNDGRLKNWNDVEPIDFNDDFYKVGFTDCGFFCQREVIEKIVFFVKPVSRTWTKKQYASSGVGNQLTKRFLENNISMFIPKKSLAFHGEHESKMHPELRKIQPLISK
jgi:hypothetical protein